MNPVRPKVFNSIAEALMYALMLLLLIMNVVGLKISSDNAAQAKQLAAQNQKFAAESQKQTLVARQQNMARQDQLKGYIECVLLLGKANPTIDFNTTTFDQTKIYLDKCASSTDGT